MPPTLGAVKWHQSVSNANGTPQQLKQLNYPTGPVLVVSTYRTESIMKDPHKHLSLGLLLFERPHSAPCLPG